ncbi:CPBP family intramembrane glutamic endopeptidase [Thioalkalivibrio sulfidiphilus]|uniref:CPBP family intramembrane glutamic endopeptidase n=1 Tax=Thioalkalivibrio sulfidiphilus TaxID=1033854 RepID=UPI00037FFF65|nr:CPBP family intramembrane glutamic endopeptidase [Thioalkalivibrio sulfidiphilus]
MLPDFVDWWLAWAFYPIIYVASDGSIPVLANLLNLVSLVVLAPLIEEILFRGYLLHRLAQKWGLWVGVVVSSALFGAVHPDTLAAAVTGFGLALLYLKTRTLWAPILAHALYNLLVWFWELHGVVVQGADYHESYGIEQLRQDWWVGAVALIVLVLIVDRLMRQRAPLGPFALPGDVRPSGMDDQRS